VVSLSVSVLLLFIVAGAASFEATNLQPFAPAGVRGILEAAALLFFAYTGYARVATLGEEVHEPRRTIPQAIVIALGTSFVLYVGVSLVAVGAIGAEAMGRSASPLQEAASAFPFRGASAVVGVGAVTAMLGVLLSQVFGISRMVFAMARRGDLPGVLGHVHPRHAVPDHAVLLAGTVIVIVAMLGTLKWVVAASTFTILIYYMIANVAALRMPADQKLYPDAVAAVGFAFCAVLALSLQPLTISAGGGLLVLLFVARAAVRRLLKLQGPRHGLS
jgi:APA family basic amino acid/polyamine antiporter